MTPDWYKQQPYSPAQVYDADVIRDIQCTLQCPQTGEMDVTTVNHIKGVQSLMGLRPSGIIDLPTAQVIERIRSRYEHVR